MKEFLDKAQSFSAERVMQSICEITGFHRIQGSRGLVDAARYVQKRVKGAELIEEIYDGEGWYLTLQTPIGWDLVEGSIEFDGKKMTAAQNPLLVMAHSPPGRAEGEVVSTDSSPIKGKIVLAGKEWRGAYKKACKNGAKGFIAYRSGTGDDFPYIGLFLRRKDLEHAIPAVAIPESLAKEIEGKRVRISVKTRIRDRETMPIVYAEIGKPPFILFSAHMCHPKPGANDNASGSAMLIELAKALEESYDPSFRFGFAFLWIPEHYGTQAFIEKHADMSRYYVCINLDMVGGSSDRSGSHIMLSRAPLSRFSVVSGLIEHFMNEMNVRSERFSGSPLQDLQFRTYPFSTGSDHEVFNFFDIPSVMLITWPDRYHHSSGDIIENLSSRTIEVIGKSVLATALSLAESCKEELERFARAYAMRYAGELGMRSKTDVADRLMSAGIKRDMEFIDGSLHRRAGKAGWMRWIRKGVISEDLIEERDRDSFKGLEELLPQLYELLMLGEQISEKDSFRALREEFGEIKEGELKEMVQILESSGVVEIKK